MSETQGGTTPEQPESIPVEVDFALNVYRGCVLPEDYRPVRITTWQQWIEANPDDYSEQQLDHIKQRLMSGKSWVCFVASLETISAPDHYKPTIPYSNPVKPKDQSYVR